MTRQPEAWSDALLDQLRTQADPEADDAAAVFFAERAGADHGLFFRTAAGSAEDPVLASWLAGPTPLPDWADTDRIAQGAAFFSEHGLTIGLSLFCAALPLGYAAAPVANVLGLTARLESDVRHRVLETAQLVLDVTQPGGLLPGGAGHIAARRVRLIHAGVRWLVLHDPRVPAAPTDAEAGEAAYWDERWGVPVSQEHLLGALLAFGTRSLTALDRLGVAYDPQAAEDWLHLWSCVAALLGIEPALLPVDRASGTALDALLTVRDVGPSAAGQRLTAALLGLLYEMGPARVLRGLPRAAMHALLGPAIAADLAVPPAGWERLLFTELSGFLRLGSLVDLHHRLLGVAVRRTTRAILEGFVTMEREGDRPAFAIPTELADAWSVGVTQPRPGRTRQASAEPPARPLTPAGR